MEDDFYIFPSHDLNLHSKKNIHIFYFIHFNSFKTKLCIKKSRWEKMTKMTNTNKIAIEHKCYTKSHFK